jgi:tyrosyl-tRNA synthetase
MTTEDIPDRPVARDRLDADGRMPLARLVVALGLEVSTSNSRRVAEQGGVRIDGMIMSKFDPRADVAVMDGMIVRCGKVKAARVKLVGPIGPTDTEGPRP